MIHLRAQQNTAQRIVLIGDSVTSLQSTYNCWGPLQTSVAATIPTLTTTSWQFGNKSRTKSASVQLTPVFINSGVSGRKASDAASDMAATVLQYSPDAIFICFGPNDASANVTPANYAANIQSIITQTLSAFPRCQVMICSPWVSGEVWATGPVGNNPGDATFDAYSAAASGVATAGGYTFCDLRAGLWTYEQANNPGKVSSGILSVDGTHPNTAGQNFISSAGLACCTVRYV